ncbi:zinc finger C3HC4 type domain containing protein [Nitzschia inconspicua]|uniref:Zinc finger C3HC4 type domain containing protein n=1 Tax=Nitzschia inconspicua TaxID=303405 RepID=A0A9K3PC56_9STRA|nr:zinc finger C3HC4 type domain containing protein [Nitzschia inconspicua]
MASPFSFHCMVCFEEFDTDNRFPVVLPCGHTYICNACACRLDKCMECRTPLVELIPRKGPPNSTNSVNGRHSRTIGPKNNAPPTPPIKKRLPLPKNVVLMSLIEATELAAETVQGREHEPSMNESPMIAAPSILDLEDDEEEKIKTGTTLAISDCGTYAVAAKDGLEIFPSRPDSLHSPGHEHSEEDVDTLVRFFHMDHMLDLHDGGTVGATGSTTDGSPSFVTSTSPSHEEAIVEDKKMEDESPRKDAPPVRLSWGDRVQIVSLQNGWAKLARGYGYVRAGAQQLVKVGSSVDRSCKLEAMLRMLSSRRKELREEQKRIDNQFISLMNELQVSLMADEDLTVIAADTFHKNLENDPSAASIRVRDSVELHQPDLEEPDTRSNTNYEDQTPLKPRFTERPMTPPGDSSRGIFFCTGSDVLNAVLPLSTTRTQPPALPNTARSPAIAQEFHNHAQNHRHLPPQQSHQPQSVPRSANSSLDNVENTPTRILTSASHPSPSALRAGARAWRELHGRPPSDGIDFRTGMSGHSALLSSSAHPHDYLVQTQRFFAGMSNHTGLTMWKAKKPPNISSTASMETNSLD